MLVNNEPAQPRSRLVAAAEPARADRVGVFMAGGLVFVIAAMVLVGRLAGLRITRVLPLLRGGPAEFAEPAEPEVPRG